MPRVWGRRRVVLLAVVTAASAAGAVALLGQEGGGETDGGMGAEVGRPAAVEVVPIQIGPTRQGLALIDREHQTICVYGYRLHPRAPGELELLAVRSFRYDCQLEDFNTAAPRPAEVKELVEMEMGAAAGHGNTVLPGKTRQDERTNGSRIKPGTVGEPAGAGETTRKTAEPNRQR